MVGEILKKKREESGKDLKEISDSLKIKCSYLKAIEDEEFEKLPDEVYVRGYILEYAKILHIPTETVLNSYIQQISPPQPEKNNPSKSEPSIKKGLKFRYLLIPAALLILLAIIVVFIQRPHPPEKKELLVSSSQTEKKELPVSSPETQKKELPVSSPETKAENAIINENRQYVLEILATDPTWLLVITDEKDSREVLMKPGESLKWYAKKCFSLKIGNAGGVQLVFNGKNIGKLGEKGQVVKIDLPDIKT